MSAKLETIAARMDELKIHQKKLEIATSEYTESKYTNDTRMKMKIAEATVHEAKTSLAEEIVDLFGCTRASAFLVLNEGMDEFETVIRLLSTDCEVEK